MMKHTKEPWWNHGVAIKANDNIPAQATSEANARRIVACVNACAGIPTEMLEAMPSGPAEMLPMYARLEQQRDELLEALEPFGSIDLCAPRLPSEFAMLVLRARTAIANVKGSAT